jgi:hypothetical protein
MDNLVKDVYQGAVNIFNNYEIKSDVMANEIQDWKDRFKAMCEKAKDLTDFYALYANTGLQEENMNLMAKVSMIATGSLNEDGSLKTDYSDRKTAAVSVKDYVEQYRAPYDEIKKAGYRKRAEKAYENIFAVADKTDDMAEAQILLEDGRMFLKIVTEDALDIFEPILEALDPLQDGITYLLKRNIEIYKAALSDEEIYYRLECIEPDVIAAVLKFNLSILFPALILSQVMVYLKNKDGIADAYRVVEGPNQPSEKDKETLAKASLSQMLQARATLRAILTEMEKYLKMTFAELMANEGMKVWFLIAAGGPVGDLNRVYIGSAPDIYELVSDVIENEILPDVLPDDILTRHPKVGVCYSLTITDYSKDANRINAARAQRAKQYRISAEAKAKELTSHLTYYKYVDELRLAAGDKMPKIENNSEAKKSDSGSLKDKLVSSAKSATSPGAAGMTTGSVKNQLLNSLKNTASPGAAGIATGSVKNQLLNSLKNTASPAGMATGSVKNQLLAQVKNTLLNFLRRKIGF